MSSLIDQLATLGREVVGILGAVALVIALTVAFATFASAHLLTRVIEPALGGSSPRLELASRRDG
jgi:hypothetical protein